MAGIKHDIKTDKDLKGKKVAIFPGSTQEAVILERLRMEGMTIKDIQPIRLSFSDMAAALARGDVDAYVGAEPAGGISLANGTGKLVEYPYSTPIGPLNMIVSASQKAVKEHPERIKLIVDMHRKAEIRKSTRLNSSHTVISYAVFCLQKSRIIATSST